MSPMRKSTGGGGLKAEKNNLVIDEDPMYPLMIQKLIGLHIMLFDSKIPGIRQTATTQAIFRTAGIKIDDFLPKKEQ